MDPFFCVGRIPVFCVSVIFFLMTIRKFWSDAKNIRRLSSQFKLNECFSPLFVAFVRDGTVFFLLIAVVLLISTTFSLAVEGPLEQVPLVWLTTVYSYSATRLIINLREAALMTRKESTWNETMQLSALDFANCRSPSVDATDN
ncbi:hypothetical protein Ac2012v2_006718 [Leucoagaricus gongylophorus]